MLYFIILVLSGAGISSEIIYFQVGLIYSIYFRCIHVFVQTPTQSLIKVYLSEDEEDKRMNSKEMEEANDMMPM